MKDYITLKVDAKKQDVDTNTREILISERLGIKALYSFNRKKILKYYLPEETFDMEKAKEWYEDFKETKVYAEEPAKKFFKKNEEKRIVYGVVYAPFEVDLQGDMMDEEAIEDMAHKFMEDYQNIDEMHSVENMGKVLESYIVKEDFEQNEVKITKGSWVLVTRANEDVWTRIKNGELIGYSIGYEGTREEIEV